MADDLAIPIRTTLKNKITLHMGNLMYH